MFKCQENLINKIILFVSILWSLFQLWIASPLPYWLANYGINLIISETQSRTIHLALAIFLCFFVAEKQKCSTKIIFYIMGIVGFLVTINNFIFFEEIAMKAGIINNFDVTISIIGIIILLIATQQSIGFPIVVVGSIFILYSMFGNLLPMIISHRGHDLGQISYQQWLSSEGVFGVALGVSADFIFLFVLFGGFLEASGASNFFIKLAFAWLGKLRNGAAKATIIGSALMGIMSGSSVATTITVGTMTIPLMKKAGFSGEKAGGIQIAAGVNGQITPPIMGAAAFLMAEFLSIPYSDVIKYALLPAIIIYFSLFYSVHLERTEQLFEQTKYNFLHALGNFLKVMISFIISFALCALCLGAFYFLMQGIHTNSYNIPGLKHLFHGSFIGIILFLVVCYLAVIYLQFKVTYQNIDSIHEHNEKIKDLKEYIENANPFHVLIGGFHYLIPIFILLWLLTVERLSSSISVFWSIVAVLVIIFTHNNLLYLLHKKLNLQNLINELKEDFGFIIDAMQGSAKNMISIALATAVSGIIIGSISQTGISQAFVDILETVARDNILIILITTAIICIILGMGMPTTACYMIVSSLMVPVIYEITQSKGMSVSPVALHFFVFYFGLMADITPPVGLASYAAAAISGANPIKTAVQGLKYNRNVMLLPFMFVYNNELIYYNISTSRIFVVTIFALIASIAFVASLQGNFLTKNKFYESVMLFMISISIFNPNLAINLIQKPYKEVAFMNLNNVNINEFDLSKNIQIKLADDQKIKNFYFKIDELSDKNLLNNIEDSLQVEFKAGEDIEIAHVSEFNNKNANLLNLLKNDYTIKTISLPVKQFSKKLVWLANLLMMFVILLMQHFRKMKEQKMH